MIKHLLAFLVLCFFASSAFAQGAALPSNQFVATPPAASGVLAPRAISGPDLPTPTFNAKDYGVKCDASTDDTTNMQSAINAAEANNGLLLMPIGQCNISATLNITTGMTLRGSGSGLSPSFPNSTAFQWVGASTTTPMFNIQGVRDATFEDFVITADSGHPLATAIQSTTISGKTTTHNHYYRIYIDGTTSAINKGFAFVAGSGGDNNNDENTFIDVLVVNYATAAWSFEHTQSKTHEFINCIFEGGPGQTNQYGVTTALGSGTTGGSFLWYGGGGGANAEADFFLGSPEDIILISGGDFENSGRLLEGPGNNTSAWPVTIQGIRWAGNSLNADGKAIIYGSTGPLNLIGNLIGQFSANALTINMTAASSNNPIGVAIGNNIGTSVATPFVGGVWATFGNNLNSPSTSLVANTPMALQGAVLIANLPSCTAATVGSQMTVSNGQSSPTWKGAVSTTGSVYAPVGCVQTGSSTYGWVYR